MIGNAKHFVLPGGEAQARANAHHGDFPKQSHGVVRLVRYVPTTVQLFSVPPLPIRAPARKNRGRDQPSHILGRGRVDKLGAIIQYNPVR